MDLAELARDVKDLALDMAETKVKVDLMWKFGYAIIVGMFLNLGMHTVNLIRNGKSKK